jgi:murein L,D-transpeptidase YcbB/YkuD
VPDAQTHVTKLEKNDGELEEDIRTLDSTEATGEETIRELLQQQVEQKKENSNLRASLAMMEEIQNTTMDQLEKERQKGSTNVIRDKYVTISKLEKELSDERAKLKRAEGRDVEYATLHHELAAECAKSKRLKERLGPLLAAAVAVGSL